ncbi:MAG: Platinum sensitivity protein [Vezdaea aestivalis]|nr:MAG: Platinum sensitivity protein [Vezdaea aestivalis]
MEAPLLQPPEEKKRVKVYELKESDWFDRGTGFCVGNLDGDGKILVESEENPEQLLLETKIIREDTYQKQQDTLIVWTDKTKTDMALSFQEADGCAAIWRFVSEVQAQLHADFGPVEEALSDDPDSFTKLFVLPTPDLTTLPEIEQIMRQANMTPQGRDTLSKKVISDEYIPKLIPLVSLAETRESLTDLHRLCNIMKILILLNDNAIIEHVVTDEIIIGVVGALEYDPDFPSHKANHRQYLSDESKFKEVVTIEDPFIKRKIHYTYRLQYLKDVVLARILDDPTFSVLNSLIFFNQVDIVTHLQQNGLFIKDLFGVFNSDAEPIRKKHAVQFIQQLCAIAKNLQNPVRASLYTNFIGSGLLGVINYALRHVDASVRVAGTDVLVAMIDHDPAMMRSYVLKQLAEKQIPLTDSLIELLLVEVDLGVKSQIADAIKVLLDPQSNPPAELTTKASSHPKAPPLDPSGDAQMEDGQFTVVEGPTEDQRPFDSFAPFSLSRNFDRRPLRFPNDPVTEYCLQNFYDESAKKLFKPLSELQHRESSKWFLWEDDRKKLTVVVLNLTVHEVSLFSRLVEILCFFMRQHQYRIKFFIISEQVPSRIAQLLSCPQKHLKLMALKFFRTAIGLKDEFYTRQLVQQNLFAPILNVVFSTMPRDNLLNSACLELFEFIKRENIKPLVMHIVESFRDQLAPITYVDTFQSLLIRYDQLLSGYSGPTPDGSMLNPDGTPAIASQQLQNHAPPDDQRQVNGGARRWQQGVRDLDQSEEDYYFGDDDELEASALSPEPEFDAPQTTVLISNPSVNGITPRKPLVSYGDDDEDDEEEATSTPTLSSSPPLDVDMNSSGTWSDPVESSEASKTDPKAQAAAVSAKPPERLAEKRSREYDEEDELGKLTGANKRRSTGAWAGNASVQASSNPGAASLRKKRIASAGAAVGSLASAGGGKKIAITLAIKKRGLDAASQEERNAGEGEKGSGVVGAPVERDEEEIERELESAAAGMTAEAHKARETAQT